MIFFYLFIAATLLLTAAVFRAAMWKRDFNNAFFLLTKWRQFGEDMAHLYPDIYAELSDHRADGSRWDLRGVSKAAEALAKLDRM